MTICIFYQHYKAHTPNVIQHAARFPGFQKSTNLLFGKFYSKFYNISNARLVYFSYLPAFSIVDRFIGFREMKNSASCRAASDVSLPLNYNTTRHRTQYNNTTQHKTRTENNTVQQGTTQLPQHNREQHSIHYEDKLGQTNN